MAKLKYLNELTGEWEVLATLDPSDLDLQMVNSNLHIVDVNGSKIGNGVNIEASTGALKTLVVDELPTEDISTETIYMLPTNDSDADNAYEEYVYTNGKWEKLGDKDTVDTTIRENLGTVEDIKKLFRTEP